MSLYRLLLRSLHHHHNHHRSASASLTHHFHTRHPTTTSPNPNSTPSIARTYAFSSAEEAAAERRRRKRRLRIEPPLHAIRPNPQYPPARDPNAPRLPDSTSALVGSRLNLHNRVQSLIRASDLDAASYTARQAVFSNTRPTVFTCNAIIAAMYRAKRYNEAVALFAFFFEQFEIVPNVVSYNNLINTHCDEGRVDEALRVYRKIIETAPFSPSHVTYRHLTKGFVDSGRIDEALNLLREMLNKGQGADSLVYNNLIFGYLNVGNLAKANELFDELKERCVVYDGVVNATFMEWWFNQGKENEAMESYKSLLDKNFRMIPATCNVLLEVLLMYGKKAEAWALFAQMLDNHQTPTVQAVNSETFNIMVNECFKLGKFSEAIDTFKRVGTHPKSKSFLMDVAGYNNIIARLCENEMLEEAEKLFGGMSTTPDVTTFRTLIDAYLKVQRIDDALRLFNQMAASGMRVVLSFGTRVFSDLISNGKAAECALILIKMGEKDPKPDFLIYDVVVRGLLNEGLLDLSKDVIDQMMSMSVGITPTLQNFVCEAFGQAGRGEEIEEVLNADRYAPLRPPSRMTGPPRTTVQQPLGPNQTSGQQPFVSNSRFNQMSGQQPFASNSGYNQMLGHQPFASNNGPNKTSEKQPFVSNTIAQQQHFGNNQMTGEQSLGPNQTAEPQNL
ncbi:hypothetical protein LWI28_025859 [Acer negundo]|uniref:Pentatricopeptide repeat-containing protein n=1 Tax=Acer negundo TaxID=4023 RepID=A0AAD5IBS8_ACENE|nr:hypothetical protein LWI28_025859 [Acer negundo]